MPMNKGETAQMAIERLDAENVKLKTDMLTLNQEIDRLRDYPEDARLLEIQSRELLEALQNMTGLFGEAVTRHQMGRAFGELHQAAVQGAKAVLAKYAENGTDEVPPPRPTPTALERIREVEVRLGETDVDLFRKTENKSVSTLYCDCGETFVWAGFDDSLEVWAKKHKSHLKKGQ